MVVLREEHRVALAPETLHVQIVLRLLGRRSMPSNDLLNLAALASFDAPLQALTLWRLLDWVTKKDLLEVEV